MNIQENKLYRIHYGEIVNGKTVLISAANYANAERVFYSQFGWSEAPLTIEYVGPVFYDVEMNE